MYEPNFSFFFRITTFGTYLHDFVVDSLQTFDAFRHGIRHSGRLTVSRRPVACVEFRWITKKNKKHTKTEERRNIMQRTSAECNTTASSAVAVGINTRCEPDGVRNINKSRWPSARARKKWVIKINIVNECCLSVRRRVSPRSAATRAAKKNRRVPA